MVGVVGAVEGSVAQGCELGLDAVEPGAVGRGVGHLDVVRRCPGADALALFRGQVRGEVVAVDRDPHRWWVKRAELAAKLQELGPLLDRLDVAVELVLGLVQGIEQVPDPAVAVVGRPAPWARGRGPCAYLPVRPTAGPGAASG